MVVITQGPCGDPAGTNERVNHLFLFTYHQHHSLQQKENFPEKV
jgi:hypothetical protein